MLSVLSLEDQAGPDGEHVHASAIEAVDGFFRRARFILVEAGIQDDGDSVLCSNARIKS